MDRTTVGGSMKLLLCISIQIIILLITFAMFTDANYSYNMTINMSFYLFTGATFFALEIMYVFAVMWMYGKLDFKEELL